jgi:type IV secretion system protein VirB5
MSTRTLLKVSASLLPLVGMSAANAQFAVIDVSAINQLVTQVRTLQQQLTTAQSALAQAQAAYQSITGSRGMQQLLAGTVRNYLPPDWPQLSSVLQGGANGWPTLSSDFQAAVNANAVLTSQQLAMLSAPQRQQIDSGRQSVAMLQALTREALANSSARFTSEQQLIDIIPTAQDQKGILELQARMVAEQSMLQGEQTKLQVLSELMQAQALATQQQAREQILTGHGQFLTRFQASLP